jgi:hypothetical protein
MLPLCGVLGERLLISGDALEHVGQRTIGSRVPVVVDRLKFDAQRWSKAPRRDSVFVFAVPSAAPPLSDMPQILFEVRKCDAQMTAEGFRLMVNARYPDAVQYFTQSISEASGDSGCRRTWARMLALAQVFAVIYAGSDVDVAPYFRSECCLFDVADAERLYLDAIGLQQPSHDARL